jgi:hypothetical protein
MGQVRPPFVKKASGIKWTKEEVSNPTHDIFCYKKGNFLSFDFLSECFAQNSLDVRL